MIFIHMIGYFLFVAAIGYYTATTLQWYGYKLGRAIFHHTKPLWNVWYFLLPYGAYMLADAAGMYGWTVAVVYVAMLWRWYKTLDKPLVFTGRIKRFFGILMLFALLSAFALQKFTVFIPLLGAIAVSHAIEKIFFWGFKRQAQRKLDAMKELTVIGITASYGKTSIKNFIAHLLSQKYRTYATPRSVNTFGGIVKDINEALPDDSEVYVVEMGAREPGNIAEIAIFVNPHITVVGRIGTAHLEYFKSVERIRNTKMEMLQSARMQRAFLHETTLADPKGDERIELYGTGEMEQMRHINATMHRIEAIEATLEHTCFKLDGKRYCADILGAFNAENLAVAILVAKAMGISEEEMEEGLRTLKPVAHRLQRIDAGGKVILDDSFNGNIDGMKAAFDLAATHQGRKVVITPGLVEVDESLNIEIAKRANEVFDLIIVTGDLNYPIFKRYVDEDKLKKLSSKAQMERMLAEETKTGDLILFANDAPSFV